MDIVRQIANIARAQQPRIVMSEGEDHRVIEASKRAARDGLARLVLLGERSVIEQQEPGLPEADLIEVIDPNNSDRLDDYADIHHELRRHKGIDRETARRAMIDPLGFAAMMVRQGDADGTIGGAVATTADTVRAALQIIGRAPGAGTVSSFFLMLLKEPFLRPVVFADCALIIEPTPAELASIAIASAQSFKSMTGEQPRVAMLSFSTKGSAKDASIDRIRAALPVIQAQAPDLIVDGEIQFDAAIIPEIGRKKAPGSPVAGHANVFVFPSLNAANIGYKIAQRIGGAEALGPVLQGLNRPANDLSRGCNTEDIYQMIAITGAQAAAQA